MPVFKPITEAIQIPKKGTAFERSVMDLKGAHETGKQYECAKDMAAFSNALGGVILVGIGAENDQAGDLAPLTPEQAKEAVDDYSQAMGHCSPRMRQATVERIAVDGGIIVAVNVEPSPSQLIGVRHRGSEEHYRFPLRAGTHTIPIHPENLAMYMDPRVRRVVILLRSIPEGAKVQVVTPPRKLGQGLNTKAAGSLVGPVEVDEARNVVIIPGNQNQPRTVSLDAIETVFSPQMKTWVIVCDEERFGGL